MKEASKTLATLTEAQKKEIFGGSGIDIGCGNDLIVPHFKPFDRQQGDANKLYKYIQDKYHCVAAIHCLQHLINPYKAIQDMWQLVQPGGYLVIAVPDQDLYEQGVFPSRWNRDHRWTFTMDKAHSWSEKSINVSDLIKLLDNSHIIKFSYKTETIIMSYRIRIKPQVRPWHRFFQL